MTPEAAIQAWLESFGCGVYAATATPSGAQFPYITYDLVVGDWGAGEVNMAVNLWCRTDSEAEPNTIVREVRDALKNGGAMVPCEGGALWLKQGSPWAQAIRVEGEDDKIKRRYINVNVDYLLTS